MKRNEVTQHYDLYQKTKIWEMEKFKVWNIASPNY